MQSTQRWSVLAVDGDGNVTVRLTTEGARMHVGGPVETMSTGPVENESAGSPLDAMQALDGTSYTVVLDTRGALVRMAGLEEMRDPGSVGSRHARPDVVLARERFDPSFAVADNRRSGAQDPRRLFVAEVLELGVLELLVRGRRSSLLRLHVVKLSQARDHWDLDHPFERLLLDTAVAPDPATVPWINPRLRYGEVRKVVTGIPGKTGIVYTLDRETGEFLWATPTVTQNVISGIDGATGAVTENPEVVFTGDGQTVLACPTLVGGKDWEAGAYSPQTGLMYFPLRNACARMMATAGSDSVATSLYALAVRSELAPGTEQLGTVQAISPETGELAWKYEQRAATTSLVATGGGLVFGGDLNGRFRALDAETGDVLWEVNLGSPITGFPIAFAVDGRQYVAVSTGSSRTLVYFAPLTPGSGKMKRDPAAI
ncbi:MAG: PQQ-binding-like beta-propeller repeat protein [Acidobacteria bacterium]|nr:PQQ-binding-like beta-propeller repeat protein [Acidobacteriota bacterium]